MYAFNQPKNITGALANKLYYSEIHLKNIEIYLSKLYIGTYYENFMFMSNKSHDNHGIDDKINIVQMVL